MGVWFLSAVCMPKLQDGAVMDRIAGHVRTVCEHALRGGNVLKMWARKNAITAARKFGVGQTRSTGKHLHATYPLRERGIYIYSN